MNLSAPLTEEELDELEQFLTSDATPEECMDIAMLDGFLTALVIGPNTILPSQWLPAAWGETEEDEMVWDSAEQMQRILGLVMRHFNERALDLHEDIDEFEPLIYQWDHEGETTPIIDEWCMGFMRGVGMDLEGWSALLKSDKALEFLAPMLLYGAEEGWKKLEAQPQEADKNHDEVARAIGPCVIGIRDYWLPHRKAASTYRRETTKVGRNDPCPCGSGKKFKKCCGGGGRLH
jgi:uncharacterized protein